MEVRRHSDRAVNGSAQPAAPALAMHGILKRFGSLAALDGVAFSLSTGRVHALLGENGAGKSTLMRIAFGMTPPDAGRVELFGVPQVGASVRSALAAGVGMVHQHLSLVPNLSVAENLVLGSRGRYRTADALDLLARTEAAAGLAVPRARFARDLSIVEQQRLEILKALSRGARLLILDEPTAVLAPGEIEELLRWLRSFVSAGGSVVLVTHKLREALAVADDVTVLRRGRVVEHGTARDYTEWSLARAMFGDAAAELAGTPSLSPGPAVAELTAVTLFDERGAGRVRDVTMSVHRREIVGLAAVEGSGHRHLLAALAGLPADVTGTLRLPQRVAYVPADRLRDALIPEFSLTENVALRDLSDRRGIMPWGAVARHAETLIQRFGIATRSAGSAAGSLSGGNQQRLVLARELDGDVDLVVADNPTRGLDARASAFVHGELRAAAEKGAGVVVHSSDVDEVLALATRVLVVFHGHVREVPRDRASVSQAMLGAA